MAYQRSLKAMRWARQLSSADDWVVVDLETTALGETAEILEIAIVAASGQVLLDSPVRAGRQPTEGARAVHGIGTAAAAQAPGFAAIARTVRAFLKGRRVIAYNAEFDRRVLENAFARLGAAAPAATWECAMTRYAQWRGHWRSLRAACAVEGIPISDPHRAAGDAMATWRLVTKMAGDSGIGERSTRATVEQEI